MVSAAQLVRALCLAALAFASLLAGAQAPTYRVTDLGAQFGAGYPSRAMAINDNGQIVGYREAGPFQSELLYWSSSTGTIKITDQAYLWAYINASGMVVGTGNNGWDTYPAGEPKPGPFFWRPGTAPTSYSQLQGFPRTGFGDRRATGLTDDGDAFIGADLWRGATHLKGWGLGGLPIAINNAHAVIASSFSGVTQNCPWASLGGLGNTYFVSGGTALIREFSSCAHLAALNNLGKAVGYRQVSGVPQYPLGLMPIILDTTTGQFSAIPIANGPTRPFAINDLGVILLADGLDANLVEGGPYVWDAQFGLRSIVDFIHPSDPWKGVLPGFKARALNNRGQIVGESVFGGRARAFLLTPSTMAPPPVPLTVEVVEPVTAMITDDGAHVRGDDANKLAVGGRDVQGVAADGTTTVLIRVRGGSVGEALSIGLPQTGCEGGSPTSVCGTLGSPGETPSAPFVATSFVQTTTGPVAFAIYRAPADFAWVPEHHTRRERTVTLVASTTRGPLPIEVKIARPPQVILYGLWGHVNDARTLAQQIEKKQLYAAGPFVVDHGQFGSPKTVRSLAQSAMKQVRGALADFRDQDPPYAAAQVDIVAHGVGGLVARYLPQFKQQYRNRSNLMRGSIHKLITVGTPHLGTPFAEELTKSGNACWTNYINLTTPELSSRQGIGSLAFQGAVLPEISDKDFAAKLGRSLDNTLPTAYVASQIDGLQVQGVPLWVTTGSVLGTFSLKLGVGFGPARPELTFVLADWVPGFPEFRCDAARSSISRALANGASLRTLMGGDHDGFVSVRSATNGLPLNHPSVRLFAIGRPRIHMWQSNFYFGIGDDPFLPYSEQDTFLVTEVLRLINEPITSQRFAKN